MAAVGRSENPEGWAIICHSLPLIEIGLTNMSISGGGGSYPLPPAPTARGPADIVASMAAANARTNTS